MDKVLLNNSPLSLVQGFTGNNKKSLGQNFLVDDKVTRAIAQEVSYYNPTDILEIGPGAGSLTLELLKINARYHAIEKDTKCTQYLESLFHHINSFDIRNDDILNANLPACCYSHELRTIVVSNLPYNIATQIYFTLVEQNLTTVGMVLMFQKEVADRYIAKPNSKSYGILSVLGNYFHYIDPILTVSPESFRPRPKVMSSVLSFRPKPRALDPENETLFRNIVKQAFALRRKTLANSLQGFRGINKIDLIALLEKANIDPNARAENLSLKDYISLTHFFGDSSLRETQNSSENTSIIPEECS